MSSFGFLVRQELIGTTKFGFISKGALSISEIPAKIKHIIYKNYFKQQSSFLKTKKTRHSNKKSEFTFSYDENAMGCQLLKIEMTFFIT